MDILYVGNEINGSFISEISKKDKITYSGTYTRVADYENIIFSSSYEVILFDVDNLIDEAEIITEYFVRAKNAKNATIIIVAIGYSYQSLLIEKLLNAGFKNFILATSLAKQYEEYSKCLEGYYEENGIDIKATEEPQQIIRQKVKTIALDMSSICLTEEYANIEYKHRFMNAVKDLKPETIESMLKLIESL